MPHVPRRIRASYGSMLNPVRTNLPYPGVVGGMPPGVAPFVPQGQLLTNLPDSWEITGGGPVGWSDGAADDGNPPAWWVGRSVEDGWSAIGPHGPGVWQYASLPVVTRVVSLIVDPLTAGQFRVRDGAASADVPRWLSDPQLLRPDDRFQDLIDPARKLPRSVFWRRWIATAVWWGKSYLAFQEDASGGPTAGTLRQFAGFQVEYTQQDGWHLLKNDGGKVGLSARDGKMYIVGGSGDAAYRLVALHNPHGPLGVFASHPAAFDYARKISRYGGRVFGAGVPNGYLKVTAPGLTQEQADVLKARWMAAHGGQRSIAVLNSTTDFTPIAWSPVDTGLGEQFRLSLADVAYAFGLAPETLGVQMGNSATYANVQQYFDAHRDFALSPWIAAVEGTLSSLLPAGLEVEVNLDQFMRPDYATRMAAHATAVASGVRTVEEIRAGEGYGPINETPEG